MVDTLFLNRSLFTRASGPSASFFPAHSMTGRADWPQRAAGGLTMVLDPAHKPIEMQQNAINYDGPIGFIGNGLAIAAALENALAHNGTEL
jgi:hypothetical protein